MVPTVCLETLPYCVVSSAACSAMKDRIARKSLRHHLQRDGFSGSGGAGDEAVAICKPKRQPDWLFTLPDEDFLVGIGHLVVGRSHCIASSRASRAQSPGHHDPIASCKPIEPGQRHLGGSETRFIGRDRPASCFPAPKVGANRRVRDNLPANFATALALLQHSSRDRRSKPFQMRSSLVIRIAEDQDKFDKQVSGT